MNKSTAYIDSLMAEGRYTFTIKEMVKTLQILPTAAQSAIQRLRNRGTITTLIRGFHF